MFELKIKITAKNNTDSAFATVNKNVREITNILLSARDSLSSGGM